MNEEIIQAYQNWDRDKDYLKLNLEKLRNLSYLNKIVNDQVLNKINSVAYFLQSNNYEKPQVQYLAELKNAVNSFVMIDKYFQSQKAFNNQLSQYYTIPTEDNRVVWRESNQDIAKELNNQAIHEQKAFYAMIKEIYIYGKLKKYKDLKIQTELQKLSKLPNFCMCKTSKSDSEIKRFFKMKYQVDKNTNILKIGMQDLYDFFNSQFSDYEPIHFCDEILEHILNEEKKQKRYFRGKRKTTTCKISCNDGNVYEISNIKK